MDPVGSTSTPKICQLNAVYGGYSPHNPDSCTSHIRCPIDWQNTNGPDQCSSMLFSRTPLCPALLPATVRYWVNRNWGRVQIVVCLGALTAGSWTHPLFSPTSLRHPGFGCIARRSITVEGCLATQPRLGTPRTKRTRGAATKFWTSFFQKLSISLSMCGNGGGGE